MLGAFIATVFTCNSHTILMSLMKIDTAVYEAVFFKLLLMHNNFHLKGKTLIEESSNITNIIGYMSWLPIHFVTQRGVFDYGCREFEVREKSSHKAKSITASENNEPHPFNDYLNNRLKVPLEVRLVAVWNFSELVELEYASAHACRIIRSKN